MPTEVFAALAGAGVGILGSGGIAWGLQSSQYRRQDLNSLRERSGIAKALRAELAEAGSQIDIATRGGYLLVGARLPVVTWENHGHLIMAGVIESAEFALIDAFGKARATNEILACADAPHVKVTPEMGLQELRTTIDTALGYLNDLIDEYANREWEAARPWRFWRRRKWRVTISNPSEPARERKRAPVDGPLDD